MKYDNPFPGMNPYLESEGIWPDFHNELISQLRSALTAQLPDRYHVSLQQRTEVAPPLGPAPDLALIIPDAPVTGEPISSLLDAPSEATATATAVAAPTEEATAVRVRMPREVRVTWLRVEAMPERDVVTIVEVLSPTNKAPGTGRLQYIRKREAISASYVNLVEIDLLRRGQPMPLETSPPASDYRILVCRGLEHPSALLYPFTVQQAVPKFPLPLLPDDDELEVDLGAIINAMHHTARYGQVACYHEPPPEPEFAPEVAEWVGERVASFLPIDGRA